MRLASESGDWEKITLTNVDGKHDILRTWTEQKGRRRVSVLCCLSWDITSSALGHQCSWFSFLQTQNKLHYQLADCETSWPPWSHEPTPIINLLKYIYIYITYWFCFFGEPDWFKCHGDIQQYYTYLLFTRSTWQFSPGKRPHLKDCPVKKQGRRQMIKW